VVAAIITGRTNTWTAWGAVAYVVARVAYVALYASGVPLVRSMVWNVAALGAFAVLVGAVLGPGAP
jgi:uncharacterized MAPEG superfamily protein